MKIKLLALFVVLLLLLVMVQCRKEKDTELPKIELVSPLNCDSVYRGDFIHFEAKFTDNDQLSKYAVDIKNNFDHKSYGPGDQGCDFGPDKTAFNPLVYISVNDIPPGLKEYEVSLDIIVPENSDTGDYLLIVYAEDKTGWQSFYSVSLKIVSDEP